MEEEKTYQKRYDWLKPHQFKKGNPGGPGRPKGPSLKTWLKNRFEEMTDEEREDFMKHVDPKTAWEMAEGKPDTKNTLDAKIEHSTDPELKEMVEKALEDV